MKYSSELPTRMVSTIYLLRIMAVEAFLILVTLPLLSQNVESIYTLEVVF
jgi:hypothetical protein